MEKSTRNEIDEEFRFVQKQLRETVCDLIRVHLKAKHPLKSDDVISDMADKVEKENISKDEWSEIISYMYNNEDAVALGVMLKEGGNKYAAIQREMETKKLNAKGVARSSIGERAEESKPGSMPYSDFLNVLLNFQLLGHDRFLFSFRERWQEVDKDRNGLVNEKEFRQLINLVTASPSAHAKKKGGARPTKTEAEVCKFLEIADPYNNQSITFSEAVSTLGSEIIKKVKETRDRAARKEEINRKREARGIGRVDW